MKMKLLNTMLALILAAVASPLAAATAITPVPTPATLRVATVRLRVAPDHRDWSYQLGDLARFRVTVSADDEPIDGVTVTYAVGPDMVPGVKKTALVPLEGLIVEGGTMNEPGFLRCIVTAEVAGHSYRGLATAAYTPQSIRPMQVEPADFDAFWASGKAELAKVPMEPLVTLVPEACTASVNVYHVSFRTICPSWVQVPARIYGVLCEPKALGHYPAILKLPGAGIRPYSGDRELASKGAITLEIGIHGIPVNLPQEVYDQLSAGALNCYWYINLANRNTYYYRRVYLSCVRANDFLVSREMWDGKNLLVTGGSQGGQLTIVTAALDPRVTELASTYPAFCDVAAELEGRAGGFPNPFRRNAETGGPSELATPANVATSAYYDTVNFARRLRAPGFYLWGYNDEVCPPTSTFAAYNVITAPKELEVMLEVGHATIPEQVEATNGWIAKSLNLK